MSDQTTKKDANDDKPAITTPRMVEAESEVARTRAELAATVDALADRLDPRAQAKSAVDGTKRLWSDATTKDADPHRQKRARAVIGGAVAVVALLAAAGLRRKG
ncbi:DUF3618 domain-containing protein [Cellulomonas fimi]|uniref:DUF3618 domain-containing protein n=1 Tax=Cellulomonas fimi TaxID=1708 RepID=UPI00234D36E9|nr:DUF3618 domain-containing protein [Cellulomonas fimi]MDC7122315.1 DUF3618 domain-containing protein [Cellulomonas fimi]